MGDIIGSIGGGLHSVLSSIRNILTSVVQQNPLYMYLILFVISLVLSFMFFKKVITFSPLSGKNIPWLLLLALIIFLALAFI